jgi:hypothetical protein
MKLAGFVAALVALLLLVPFFFPVGGPAPGDDPAANLPWRIETDGRGGSSVFGLRLGTSTLADVRRRFGPDLAVAIIAVPGEIGTLEGYHEQASFGFVAGRLIVTLDAAPAVIAAMRERAVRSKHMESTTRRITLSPADLELAETLPIRGVSVIPAVNLDEPTLVGRFGPPEERFVSASGQVHLLYPSRGLDLMVDSEGKELLQYVAPRDFELLRAPLRAASEGKRG